jgi:hypothetical protein
MNAEPVNVEPPKHPMYALTTYELREYRGQLERALRRLPQHAEVRALIRRRLDAVLEEQDERARSSSGSVR